MFVAHRPHGDELTTIFERTRQRVLHDFKFWMCVFFGKKLDRIEEQASRVNT